MSGIYLPTLWGMKIAISIDQVPTAESSRYTPLLRSQRMVYALQKAGAPAAAVFCHYGNHPEALAQLQAYADAGHLLGNATADGLNLTQSTLEEFAGSIARADIFLNKIPGYARYFRFPWADADGGDPEKKEGIHRYLFDNGYRPGFYTLHSYDWLVQLIIDEYGKNDFEIDWDRLKRFYIQLVKGEIHKLSHRLELLGKEDMPQVLSFSESDLSAEFLEELLPELQKDNQFISYVEAYQYYQKLDRNFEGSITVNPLQEIYLQNGMAMNQELRKQLLKDKIIIQKNILKRMSSKLQKLVQRLF